jgi:hypothetical protein
VSLPPHTTSANRFQILTAISLQRYEVGALTVKPDAALYSEMHTILQRIAKAPNVTLAFTFQPLGAPAVAKGKAKGGNVATFPAQQQSCKHHPLNGAILTIAS